MCKSQLHCFFTLQLRGWLWAGYRFVGALVVSGAVSAHLAAKEAATSINLPFAVDMVRLAPDDNTAFLIARQKGEYLLLDLDQGEVVASGELGIFPTDAVIDVSGRYAYAVGRHSRDEGAVGVARLSLQGYKLTTIPVREEFKSPAIGVDVEERIFVGGAPSSDVAVIDQKEVGLRRLALGYGPIGDIGVTDDGSLIFAANLNGDAISVADPKTGKIYSTFRFLDKRDYGKIVSPESMMVLQSTAGFRPGRTTVVYAMPAEDALVFLDFNERFVSLDVVQSINLAFTSSTKTPPLGAVAREGSSLRVASDAEQNVILVGNSNSSRVVMFSRIVDSIHQRGEADFARGVVDLSVSRSGRLAVVLTGSGRVLEVVRDPHSGGTAFVTPLTSADLRIVQEALAAQGFPIGAVDGLEGPRTSEAVKLFQRQAGLAETGQVDERTILAVLNEEVALSREFVQKRTIESKPGEWIVAQVRLAEASGILGERQADTSLLEASVAGYRAALQGASGLGLPDSTAATLQNNLCYRMAQLGAERSDRTLLEEAVVECKSALEVFVSESDPVDFGPVYHSVGFALAELGKLTQNTADLKEAIEAFRSAVEAFEATGSRTEVTMARRHLAEAEAILARSP